MQHHDPAATRHAQHDLNLIAGFAAADLTSAERTRAQALLDHCAECSALHLDLLSIVSATRTLPATPAPRDFRITTEQAARLRRTSWLGRVLAPLAGARSATRPLAATFTTLGLVGVFVASALPGILGGTASMAAPEAAGGVTAPGAIASAAPGFQFGPMASTSSEDQTITKDNAGTSAEPLVGVTGGGRDLGADGSSEWINTSATANPLLLGSLALLAVGLVLFGIRFAGRRLR